jgi:predicted acetyltransferase
MVRSPTLRLVAPDLAWRSAFVAMAHEYRAAGESRFELAEQHFAAFLAQRAAAACADTGLGRVPMLEFWLEQRGVLFGTLRLRMQLTAALEQEGGHIGYDVRPTQRRKGYGTALLDLGLEQARKRGLSRVLLTCDMDNTGSARVIEHNGGRRTADSVGDIGQIVRRYWIELRQ